MTSVDVLFFASVAGLALGVFAIVWYWLRRTQAVPARLTMPTVRYNPDTVVSEVPQKTPLHDVPEDSSPDALLEQGGRRTPDNVIDFGAIIAKRRATDTEAGVGSVQVGDTEWPPPRVDSEAIRRVAPGGTVMSGRPVIVLVDPPPANSNPGR